MFIDERVKHVGIGTLRRIDSDVLRSLSDTIYVLRDHDEPLGVLISYELYMRIQAALPSGEGTK